MGERATAPANTTWDPAAYAGFADHRSRPFADLLARVSHASPSLVVDLGCGNGPLTLSLAQRWPDARIVGVDSSHQMLAAARDLDAAGRVEWVQAELADWEPGSLGAPPDVIISNATLQWVPTHLSLIKRWVDALADGGWFAMQVPANFDAPSHALMREVAAAHSRSAELLPGLSRANAVADLSTYIGMFDALGCTVDAWETTYQHILDPEGEQDSPVLEWVRSTGLRPVLEVLTGQEELETFLGPYAAALASAYPRQPFGTVLPFRRRFAVAHRDAVVGAGIGGSPMRILGLHHVQIACPAGTEDSLRDFYSGLVGMTEIPKPPVLAARGGVWFQAGSHELHCGVEEPFVPARKAHAAFAVADVEAMAGLVERAGGAVNWDDNIPGVRRFHTADPVGNRVEFQQV